MLAQIQSIWAAIPQRKFGKTTEFAMERIHEPNPEVKCAEDLGWYTEPGKKGTAIILHGSNASPVNNEMLAKILIEKGYGIESPLLAGHGLGTDQPTSTAQELWEQVFSLVQKVKERGDFCLVIGTSMGGSLALLCGTLETPPDLIVTVSGALTCKPSYGSAWAKTLNESKGRLRKSLPKIICPVLICHDIEDKSVSPQDAYELMKKLGSKRKKCIYYTGSGHSLMFSNHCPELVEDIENFRNHNYPPIKVKISYKGQAERVYIAGEFNNWKEDELPLKKEKEQDFSIELDLVPGLYPYKFIIDGEWTLDPKAQVIPAPNGQKNSLLYVEQN